VDGRVAPGTVSQILELIFRYLKNASHPEWADRWARVYDATGSPRYAVVLIHASSNRLAASDHQAYAEGFDLVERQVFAASGVRVGFFIDALPPGSNAPGSFKPSPSQTGPFLRNSRSLLGIQCFIPEIWMAGASSDAARIKWKREFAKAWILTGIPFLMDVSPGYDAHLVFPGSVRYGHTEAWLTELAGMVRVHGCDGLAFNSWNGYTEGMAAVPLRAADGGERYFDWLKKLKLCEIFRRGDANADGAIDVADPGSLQRVRRRSDSRWPGLRGSPSLRGLTDAGDHDQYRVRGRPVLVIRRACDDESLSTSFQEIGGGAGPDAPIRPPCPRCVIVPTRPGGVEDRAASNMQPAQGLEALAPPLLLRRPP